MIIYHYHPESRDYLGTGVADPSPLEPGVWLIPANATSTPPPDARDGFRRVFLGGEWKEVEIPPPPPPEPEPPVKKYINRDRLLLAIRDQLGEDRADAIAAAILSKPFLALRFSSTDIAEDDPDFLRFLEAGVVNNLFTQSEINQIVTNV